MREGLEILFEIQIDESYKDGRHAIACWIYGRRMLGRCFSPRATDAFLNCKTIANIPFNVSRL